MVLEFINMIIWVWFLKKKYIYIYIYIYNLFPLNPFGWWQNLTLGGKFSLKLYGSFILSSWLRVYAPTSLLALSQTLLKNSKVTMSYFCAFLDEAFIGQQKSKFGGRTWIGFSVHFLVVLGPFRWDTILP